MPRGGTSAWWALGAVLTVPAVGRGQPDSGLGAVAVHGFVSPGFLLTTDNEYLADTEDGSFEFVEVGLNVTVPLTEQLRAGAQLFAHDLGPIGDYAAQFDWFYLDYRWRDWLGLRAGRVKVPFGLYNEFNDIDAGRLPVLLPQSVYPIQNRDFLLAVTGGELYGRVPLGGAGALEYRGYGGTFFLDVENDPASPFQVTDLDVLYVVGGRLLWEAPLEGLRIGGSLQALKLESDLLAGTEEVRVEIPAILWVASAEYAAGRVLLAAEYSRWYVDAQTSDDDLFPASSTTSERLYAMAAYRFLAWLQAGAYYSLLFPDVDDRDGREAHQHDVAATARFDVNDHWLVKLEAHYLNGTAALTSSLNDGKPLDELGRSWMLFALKTTVYF